MNIYKNSWTLLIQILKNWSHILIGLQIIQREDLSQYSKSIVLEICDENLFRNIYFVCNFSFVHDLVFAGGKLHYFVVYCIKQYNNTKNIQNQLALDSLFFRRKFLIFCPDSHAMKILIIDRNIVFYAQ